MAAPGSPGILGPGEVRAPSRPRAEAGRARAPCRCPGAAPARRWWPPRLRLLLGGENYREFHAEVFLFRGCGCGRAVVHGAGALPEVWAGPWRRPLAASAAPLRCGPPRSARPAWTRGLCPPPQRSPRRPAR
ncbi:unnamed protein product, partial [Prorocentrum cordatum]